MSEPPRAPLPKVVSHDARIASLERKVAELEGTTGALERLLRITGSEGKRHELLLQGLGAELEEALRANRHDVETDLARFKIELTNHLAALAMERTVSTKLEGRTMKKGFTASRAFEIATIACTVAAIIVAFVWILWLSFGCTPQGCIAIASVGDRQASCADAGPDAR